MTRRARGGGANAMIAAFGYAAALMMLASTVQKPGLGSYAAWCPSCRWESPDVSQEVVARIAAMEHIEFNNHPAYVIESDNGE